VIATLGIRGGSRGGVDRRVDLLLGQLARLLWQESGEPRLPG
jgi:hypothetical protein